MAKGEQRGNREAKKPRKQNIALRKNIARLRELRLAKEADTIRQQIAAGNDPKAKRKERLK